MQLSIKVHTKSSQKKIILRDDVYHAYVNAVPEKGKANDAVIEMLAEYLEVRKSQLKIVKGFKSRSKTIEVSD